MSDQKKTTIAQPICRGGAETADQLVRARLQNNYLVTGGYRRRRTPLRDNKIRSDRLSQKHLWEVINSVKA